DGAPDAPVPSPTADAAEADVLEQAQPVLRSEHGATSGDLPLEAADADVAEQAAAVPLDEDEGRDLL
ncbi:MAG TPA: hypothetical protein VM433_00550, partial [Mycobacteriales bacterium]|nr:hypothetical protein [Mycobacteriales bacterium]